MTSINYMKTKSLKILAENNDLLTKNKTALKRLFIKVVIASFKISLWIFVFL